MRGKLYLVMIMFAGASQTYAQGTQITWDQLGRIYADARFQLMYQAYIQANGEYVHPFGFSRLTVDSDSLLNWIAKTMRIYDSASVSKPFRGEIHAWELVSMDDREDWLLQFGDVHWSYMGNNFFTPMDTAATPEIRAHLESYFGTPTQTTTETRQGNPTPVDEDGQFEYWLVVNDSIPMIVMDVGGPFDRGIIVATDHQFRSLLYRMRQSLLTPVMRRTDPVPYVDYYYSPIEEKWYLTGYNGAEYFTHQIKRPNLKIGRPVQDISQGEQTNKSDA